LPIERPPGRRRARTANRFADEIVLEAELVSALSQDACLDQLFDRAQ
jgi:hypothetical protein